MVFLLQLTDVRLLCWLYWFHRSMTTSSATTASLNTFDDAKPTRLRSCQMARGWTPLFTVLNTVLKIPNIFRSACKLLMTLNIAVQRRFATRPSMTVNRHSWLSRTNWRRWKSTSTIRVPGPTSTPILWEVWHQCTHFPRWECAIIRTKVIWRFSHVHKCT